MEGTFAPSRCVRYDMRRIVRSQNVTMLVLSSRCTDTLSVDAIASTTILSRPEHKHIPEPQFVPSPLEQWLPYQSSPATSSATVRLHTVAPSRLGLPQSAWVHGYAYERVEYHVEPSVPSASTSQQAVWFAG
jgi:hypothetical protein